MTRRGFLAGLIGSPAIAADKGSFVAKLPVSGVAIARAAERLDLLPDGLAVRWVRLIDPDGTQRRVTLTFAGVYRVNPGGSDCRVSLA
jgi:hypothetical protein